MLPGRLHAPKQGAVCPWAVCAPSPCAGRRAVGGGPGRSALRRGARNNTQCAALPSAARPTTLQKTWPPTHVRMSRASESLWHLHLSLHLRHHTERARPAARTHPCKMPRGPSSYALHLHPAGCMQRVKPPPPGHPALPGRCPFPDSCPPPPWSADHPSAAQDRLVDAARRRVVFRPGRPRPAGTVFPRLLRQVHVHSDHKGRPDVQRNNRLQTAVRRQPDRDRAVGVSVATNDGPPPLWTATTTALTSCAA